MKTDQQISLSPLLVLSLILLLGQVQTAVSQVYLTCASYQGPSSGPDWRIDTFNSLYKCTACLPGFQLIDNWCFCPQNSYLNLDTLSIASNIYQCTPDTSIPYCIQGIIKSAVTSCSKCGYGRSINRATNACDCTGLGTLVSGGCTTIPYCKNVRYKNKTQQQCLSCKQTFHLVSGVCICPENSTFNAGSTLCESMYTNMTTGAGCILAWQNQTCVQCGYGLTLTPAGACVCSANNVQGGCTSISYCTNVRYSLLNKQSEECLACKQTFVLQNNQCVCVGGSYYDVTIDECVQVTSNNNNNGGANANTNDVKSVDTTMLNENKLIIVLSVFGSCIFLTLVILIILVAKMCSVKKNDGNQKSSKSEDGDKLRVQNNISKTTIMPIQYETQSNNMINNEDGVQSKQRNQQQFQNFEHQNLNESNGLSLDGHMSRKRRKTRNIHNIQQLTIQQLYTITEPPNNNK